VIWCDFVRLKSARAFSCLQSILEPTDWTQFFPLTAVVRFGSGKSCATRRPAGLGLAILKIRAPEIGSVGGVAPQLTEVKSPDRSAAVGTQAVRVCPRISLFHSWLQKKKSLSFRTGPPIV